MNLFARFMRTVVPIVAGLLLTLLVHLGVDVGSASVASVVTTVLTGAYYSTVRLLESLAVKIRSRPLATVAGILLGWAAPPGNPSAAHPARQTRCPRPPGPTAAPSPRSAGRPRSGSRSCVGRVGDEVAWRVHIGEHHAHGCTG
ncbi:hypothetical protein AB0D38_44865, partial [Streptomyces sp. NPDC048279]|uniref:hypothetical protein n=1 Tax=Streptomyces sp. NPDC048279 TaxID=3154714 RepID=UPI003427286A